MGRCVRKRDNVNELFNMTGETGTLRFMAPEVALCQPYTEKVDVYSFGIVIWSMVSNTLPFKSFEQGNVQINSFHQRVVLGGDRPPLNDQWPLPFQQLLTACWHKDSRNRPSFRDVYGFLTGNVPLSIIIVE